VIDFGDDDREDHVDDQAMWVLLPRVETLRTQIARYLDDSKRGELVREGVRVALVGQPNAGEIALLYCCAHTSHCDFVDNTYLGTQGSPLF
jgi:tRNA modification GTPase